MSHRVAFILFTHQRFFQTGVYTCLRKKKHDTMDENSLKPRSRKAAVITAFVSYVTEEEATALKRLFFEKKLQIITRTFA